MEKENCKLIFVIDKETKNKFQIKCIENGEKMSKVLNSFIKEYTNE